MTPCIGTTALIAAIILSLALFLTQCFRFKDNLRYRLLLLTFFFFGANELLSLWIGAPFSFFHIVLDGLIVSVAIIGLASVEINISSIASQFLFHYAIFYIALFAATALAIIEPARQGGLMLFVAGLVSVFVIVILIQEKSHRILTGLAAIILWSSAHAAYYYGEENLGRSLILCFFSLVALLIGYQVFADNKKTAAENVMLAKFRNVVLDMLNSISLSSDYLSSIEKTLQRILETITQAVTVESAALYITDEADPGKKLIYSCSMGVFYPLEPQDEFVLTKPQLIKDQLEKTFYPVGEGIVGEVAQTRKSLALDAINHLHRMSQLGLKTHLIKNLLAVPLIVKNQLFGVVVVENLRDKASFSEHDTRLLHALVDQCGISIESVRMYQELARTTRLRQEANIAMRIQKQLLPMSVPALEHLRIAPFIEPAKEVGGDYYDFIKHDKDNTGIVIGDVSGKGVPAGMIMAIAKAIIQIVTRDEKNTREIVARFSREIYSNMQAGQFMTLNYLLWNDPRRIMTFSGAGHEHVLWFHAGTGRTDKIKAGGLAAGLVEDNSQYIQQQELQCAKGDIIVLYTDGVTESRNNADELYTLRRLISSLESFAYLADPDKISESLLKDVHEFVGGAEQYDDITLLVMTVL